MIWPQEYEHARTWESILSMASVTGGKLCLDGNKVKTLDILRWIASEAILGHKFNTIVILSPSVLPVAHPVTSVRYSHVLLIITDL